MAKVKLKTYSVSRNYIVTRTKTITAGSLQEAAIQLESLAIDDFQENTNSEPTDNESIWMEE